MLQTFFYIPDHLFGAPLFGPLSILSAVWAVATLFTLGRQVYRQGINGDVLINMGMLGLVGAAICFYLPKLVVPIPDTQNVGLPIRAYGVMVLIGIVCGIWLAVQRAKKRGIEVELIFVLAIWLIVGGLIGARVFYVGEYWQSQFADPNHLGTFDFLTSLKAVLNIANGGLVIYGALIGGGVAGLLFWLFHRGLPMLRIADVIAPSMALGLGIGRIGCFLNGCCYGGVSDLPWAVTFPEKSPPYVRQLETGQLFVHGVALGHVKGEGQGQSLSGVEVLGVEKGSNAEKAGIRANELVVQIHEQPTSDPKSDMQLYPDPNEKTPQGEPDASLAAAQRALISIKGEGTKIILYTEDREKPVEWAVGKTAEMPTRSLPVQPTQIYSAIDGILLCLLLLAFDPFRRRDGEVLALMLTVHPFARFLLESIRTDEPKVYRLPIISEPLSISQFLSVVMLVGAIALWAYLLLRQPLLDESDLPPEEGEATEVAA